MYRTKHYWRIHARVMKRVWADLSDVWRYVIANDVAHETPEYQWFAKKVADDATRLYEDPDYYDNQEFSFRVGRFATDPTAH